MVRTGRVREGHQSFTSLVSLLLNYLDTSLFLLWLGLRRGNVVRFDVPVDTELGHSLHLVCFIILDENKPNVLHLESPVTIDRNV
jgi:hypothetical protein